MKDFLKAAFESVRTHSRNRTLIKDYDRILDEISTAHKQAEFYKSRSLSWIKDNAIDMIESREMPDLKNVLAAVSQFKETNSFDIPSHPYNTKAARFIAPHKQRMEALSSSSESFDLTIEAENILSDARKAIQLHQRQCGNYVKSSYNDFNHIGLVYMGLDSAVRSNSVESVRKILEEEVAVLPPTFDAALLFRVLENKSIEGKPLLQEAYAVAEKSENWDPKIQETINSKKPNYSGAQGFPLAVAISLGS